MALDVVVGIIFSADAQQILIAQRPLDKHQGGLWEFPGGKCEAGEDFQQALQRELLEELNITSAAMRPWQSLVYAYDDRKVHLHFYFCTQIQGNISGAEGQLWQWTARNCLENYSFPAANQTIVKQLVQMDEALLQSLLC